MASSDIAMAKGNITEDKIEEKCTDFLDNAEEKKKSGESVASNKIHMCDNDSDTANIVKSFQSEFENTKSEEFKITTCDENIDLVQNVSSEVVLDDHSGYGALHKSSCDEYKKQDNHVETETHIKDSNMLNKTEISNIETNKINDTNTETFNSETMSTEKILEMEIDAENDSKQSDDALKADDGCRCNNEKDKERAYNKKYNGASLTDKEDLQNIVLENKSDTLKENVNGSSLMDCEGNKEKLDLASCVDQPLSNENMSVRYDQELSDTKTENDCAISKEKGLTYEDGKDRESIQMDTAKDMIDEVVGSSNAEKLTGESDINNENQIELHKLIDGIIRDDLKDTKSNDDHDICEIEPIDTAIDKSSSEPDRLLNVDQIRNSLESCNDLEHVDKMADSNVENDKNLDNVNAPNICGDIQTKQFENHTFSKSKSAEIVNEDEQQIQTLIISPIDVHSSHGIVDDLSNSSSVEEENVCENIHRQRPVKDTTVITIDSEDDEPEEEFDMREPGELPMITTVWNNDDDFSIPQNQKRLEDFPWTDRNKAHEDKLKKAWKLNKGMCPHPYCQGRVLSKKSTLLSHWYYLHMAPGFCRAYPCRQCSSTFTYRHGLVQHASRIKCMSEDEAWQIVKETDENWEKLVDDPRIIYNENTGQQELLETDPKPREPLIIQPELVGGTKNAAKIFTLSTQNGKMEFNVTKSSACSSGYMVVPAASSTSSNNVRMIPYSSSTNGPSAPSLPLFISEPVWCRKTSNTSISEPTVMTSVTKPMDVNNTLSATTGTSTKINPDFVANNEVGCKQVALSVPSTGSCLAQSESITINDLSAFCQTETTSLFKPLISSVTSVGMPSTIAEPLSVLAPITSGEQSESESRIEDQVKQLHSEWMNSNRKCTEESCDVTFLKFWQLICHWCREHSCDASNTLTCPHCQEVFKCETTLKMHLRSSHILAESVVDHIAEKLSTKWANSININMQLTFENSDSEMDVTIEDNTESRSFVSGLPWKVWSQQSPEIIVKAWVLDGKSRCPHPACKLVFTNTKDVAAHWHSSHMAEKSVNMYSCRYGESTRYPCRAVCNTKKGLIRHCRIDHGYTDWVIEQMLKKMDDQDCVFECKLNENAITDNGKSRTQTVITPLVHTATSLICTETTSSVKPTTSLPDSVQELPPKETGVPDDGRNFHCQHGMGTVNPCTNRFRTRTGLLRHARNDHGYSDFVAQAMLRNIVVKSKDKVGIRNAREVVGEGTSRSTDSSSTLKKANDSSPNVASPKSSRWKISNSEKFSEQSDMPTVLWKAIITAWQGNRKCPHPKCSGRSFLKYSHMLGHWLRVHMDNSHMQGRFYPCLDGQDTNNLCVDVFGSSDKLTSHLISVHSYTREDIHRVLTGLKSEWDKMDVENVASDPPTNDNASDLDLKRKAIAIESEEEIDSTKKQKHDDDTVIVLD